MLMCDKKRYVDEIVAQWALQDVKMRRAYKRGPKECRYYFCNWCSAFHLTSQPFDETKRKRVIQ